MALTISYTPGYVWTVGEVITEAKLNLAANPTINLNGSISSTSIADGSVTTAKLAVGALSADATGRAKMSDGFLTLAKLGTAIFTADAAGRAPWASGWLNAALMDDGTRTLVPKYVAATLSGAAYTASMSPVVASYLTGMEVTILPGTTCIAAATLNLNGLGAKNIKKRGTLALIGGEIVANVPATLVYDGTNWQLINPAGWDYVATNATTLALGTTSFTHSLGGTPTRVRVVAVCTTANAPFAVNDEVELPLTDTVASKTVTGFYVDNTNGMIKVSLYANPFAVTGNGAATAMTLANFKWRVYASL